jgi:hypothetical protein
MMRSSETCNAYQTISTPRRSFVGHCEAHCPIADECRDGVLSLSEEKATIR